MWLYISQGLVLGLSAAAQPGPFQAYLLSQTIANGWRRTLPAAFAPLVSDGPIILLVLLVLTQTPDWFLDLMRFCGGLFLLYLAWGAYKGMRVTAVAPTTTPPATTVSRQSIFKAALMNALSPNPYIFWEPLAAPSSSPPGARRWGGGWASWWAFTGR